LPLTVNLSPSSYDPAFGQSPDASVKAKIIGLIASVRTLMRSEISSSTSIAPPRLSYRLRNDKSMLTACIRIVPLIVINTLIIVYELVLG